MASLVLPLVEPETTIKGALDQMKVVGCNGVVLERANSWTLLYARQLLEARDSGIQEVSELEGGVRVLDTAGIGIVSGPLDLERTQQAYENLFHSTRYQHAVAAVPPRTATVVANRDILNRIAGDLETDSIELPVFYFETAIQDTLDHMRTFQRPGVILRNPDASRLLHEPLLRESNERGMAVIGKVAGGWPVQFLTEILETGLDLTRPEQRNALFSRYPSQQIFAALNPRTVMLVTAHEGLTAMLSSQYGGPYKCSGKKANGRPHYFPDPSVRIGEDCPLYPECDVNGTQTVICSV